MPPSKLSRSKQRRWRKKNRRARMRAAEATRISNRSRQPYPVTKTITRYHPRPNRQGMVADYDYLDYWEHSS